MRSLYNHIHARIDQKYPNKSYQDVVDVHKVWFEAILELRAEFIQLKLFETVKQLEEIIDYDYQMLRGTEKEEIAASCNEEVQNYFETRKEKCQSFNN